MESEKVPGLCLGSDVRSEEKCSAEQDEPLDERVNVSLPRTDIRF